MNRKTKLENNEFGFASLVVGLILIIVLGLITLGFARLSRHEQQQALSSQLASEAYYAAESGINDAVKAVESPIAANQINASTLNVNSGNCLKFPLPGFGVGSNQINSTDDVSYSCVLVNLQSQTLKYGPVGVGDSRSIVTTASAPATGNPLSNLVVSWGSEDGHATYPVPPTGFPDLATWNASPLPAGDYPPVLQFSVTPLSNAMTRNGLIASAFTVFLYPTNAGPNTVVYNPSSPVGRDGAIVHGQCKAINAPYDCDVTISGLPGTGLYLLHFLDFYDASNVEITGTDNTGKPVEFSGGQAQIDVTGKAKDVLKRINVSVPLGNDDFPSYAIEAQDICKRIETTPGPATAANPIPTKFSDPNSGATGDAIANPCGLENIN